MYTSVSFVIDKDAMWTCRPSGIVGNQTSLFADTPAVPYEKAFEQQLSQQKET